jgi:hypothetical protein
MNQFRFHGYAVAVAASFEKPFSDLIESQAVAALPQIGGRSSSCVERFRYRDIFKFDLALAEVTGSKCEGECGSPEGSYNTHIRCTVEGLDVMSMVTADRIVANLVSSDTTSPDGEPSVTLLGTRFENLRIAGIPVRVDLATDLLDRYSTHSALAKAYRDDEAVRSIIDRPGATNANPAPDHIRQWLHLRESKQEMPSYRDSTRTSLVRSLTPERAGLDAWGHVIHVKGFGTIRLAEIEITRRTRLVNMLQIDFDCPYRGVTMFIEVSDGGDGY